MGFRVLCIWGMRWAAGGWGLTGVLLAEECGGAGIRVGEVVL